MDTDASAEDGNPGTVTSRQAHVIHGDASSSGSALGDDAGRGDAVRPGREDMQ